MWQAQQDLLEALATPIQFGIGFGDNVLFGLSKYARPSVGVDECSAAYQAGEWTSIAIQAAEGGVGIYRGIGKLALRQSIRSGIKVASSGGKYELGSTVRQISKGEKVGDLINEVKQLTYETGGLEHSIVSLKDGTRLIVRGGENGISFAEYDIRRVILHTHRYPTGPSPEDFKMLLNTGQRSSYIYELFGGGLTKFRR